MGSPNPVSLRSSMSRNESVNPYANYNVYMNITYAARAPESNDKRLKACRTRILPAEIIDNE